MRQGALRVSADQKPSQMHADTNAVGIGGQGNLKGGHHAGIWIWHSRLFDLPRRLLEALALDRPDPLRPRGVATKSFIVLVDVGTLSGAERCSANDSRQPGEEGRLPSQTSASNTMSSSRFWSASFSERVRHPRRRSPLASATCLSALRRYGATSGAAAPTAQFTDAAEGTATRRHGRTLPTPHRPCLLVAAAVCRATAGAGDVALRARLGSRARRLLCTHRSRCAT